MLNKQVFTYKKRRSGEFMSLYNFGENFIFLFDIYILQLQCTICILLVKTYEYSKN